MNAVTQLDDFHLEEILSDYDVGGLLRYWPAVNGIENSNYFIKTEHREAAQAGHSQEFVLTILEQQPNAGAAYVPMMLALSKSGLPVAPPLANNQGAYTQDVNGKAAMLQPRLRGQHVYNPTTKQVCALARFIARMHLTIQASGIALPEYPRNAHWLNTYAAKAKAYVGFSDQTLLSDCVGKIDSLLGRSDVRSLPQGMIHADLFRDNVLYNEYGLAGVLDFHHAAQGFWIYDLAVVANDWCNDGNGMLDPERTTALLRAYHQIRPLKKEELWFFSTFALYAALTFWLSRLNVSIDRRQNSQVRAKNPDEFKRIAAHHNSHSFYLDHRLLTTL